MAPRFDPASQKWVATGPEEEASAGYGIGKTLLLRGPKPFFHRLLQPDEYDQAVLKFMASDGVSRNDAQGNMDYYLESTFIAVVSASSCSVLFFCHHTCQINTHSTRFLLFSICSLLLLMLDPNDWAYQRYEDEKKGIQRDYGTIDEKQLVLTFSWAAIVFATIGRSVFSLSTGEAFWSFLPGMH
jgi:hypothetical protein